MKPENRRVFALHAVRVAIAFLVLGICVYLLDFSAILTALRSVPVTHLILSLAVAILGGMVIPALITRNALTISSIQIPLHTLVQINLAMRFYILVLPRAVVMGMRWLRYRRAGTGADAAALVAFERVVQLLIISIAASVLLTLDMQRLGTEGTVIWAAASVLALALAIIFGIFVSTSISSIFYRLIVRHAERLAGPVRQRVLKLWSAVEAFQALSRLHHVVVLALSAVSFILFILSAYVVVLGMELEIGLLTLTWVRSLVFILTLIPITVGGIGVREAAFVVLLGLYGVAAESAFALAIALFGVQLAIGAIGAITELLRLIGGVVARQKEAR